jgi:hypothetical protein
MLSQGGKSGEIGKEDRGRAIFTGGSRGGRGIIAGSPNNQGRNITGDGLE